MQVLPMGVAQGEPSSNAPYTWSRVCGSAFSGSPVLLPYLFRQDQFPVPVELVQPVVLPRLSSCENQCHHPCAGRSPFAVCADRAPIRLTADVAGRFLGYRQPPGATHRGSPRFPPSRECPRCARARPLCSSRAVLQLDKVEGEAFALGDTCLCIAFFLSPNDVVWSGVEVSVLGASP